MTRRELLLALAALPQGTAWSIVRIENLKEVDWRSDARGLPGSAIKPVVAMSLPQNLEFRCRRTAAAGGRRVDCTHPHLGTLTLSDAICHSCNDWFLQAAAHVTPGALRNGLLSYGINAMMPQTEAEHQLMAIGLWGVYVTPVDLAKAYARLARRAHPGIREGLERSVIEGTGAAAQPEGLTVAGKTGTAPPQAWFAGWAPREEPEIAFAVYVASGRGGTEAAPAAREVLEKWRSGTRR